MFPIQIRFAAVLAGFWVLGAAVPTSNNDPFKAIAAHTPRTSDSPMCCLKPLQPLEPHEDEVLLSFEEWKMKQSIIQEKARMKDTINRSLRESGTKKLAEGGNGSETTALPSDVTKSADSPGIEDVLKSPQAEAVPPRFKVPLTDRFNYASLDCSARVHLAHRSAKSKSSILSSKRDRYMLSPCMSSNKERHFVVVELCEDIRIDTVQLANFEFFSGVFKDFRIGVAKTYITGEGGWTDAGVYRAKNIRGVQSFYLPSLRDFYRYIRIDFLSHYGNEYYCPVSLLRVYGFTHLEQWKWEEAESKAKFEDSAKNDLDASSTPADIVAPTPIQDHTSEVFHQNNPNKTDSFSEVEVPSNRQAAVDDTSTRQVIQLSNAPVIKVSTNGNPTSTVPARPTVHTVWTHTTDIDRSSVATAVNSTGRIHDAPTNAPSGTLLVKPLSSILQQSNTSSPPTGSQTQGMPSSSMVLSDSVDPSLQPMSTPMPSQLSSITKSTSMVATVTAIPSSSIVVSVSTVSSGTSIPIGGESIYRTIMNRLTALETSHTLYTRYVEQQMTGVRELLKRLGEDVGRLEGIGRAQASMYQRTVRDWEKRQQQLQMDYSELMLRMEYLSDEIVLEKRLGIAQLCLLLAVLVFIGLTRGSRGESMVHGSVQLNKSMRDWGRRHLSFSGDWSARFKGRGRSRSISRNIKLHSQPVRPISLTRDQNAVKVEFPTREPPKKGSPKSSSINRRSIPKNAHPQLKSRSRTPPLRPFSIRHHQHYQRPVTPVLPGYRPPLQRSNSQGGSYTENRTVGTETGHISVKKWAKTAHLHEIRNANISRKIPQDDTGMRIGSENEVSDVFSSPDYFLRRHGRRDKYISRDIFGSKGPRPIVLKSDDGEGDQWIDTDFESEGDWDIGPSIISAGNEH